MYHAVQMPINSFYTSTCSSFGRLDVQAWLTTCILCMEVISQIVHVRRGDVTPVTRCDASTMSQPCAAHPLTQWSVLPCGPAVPLLCDRCWVLRSEPHSPQGPPPVLLERQTSCSIITEIPCLTIILPLPSPPCQAGAVSGRPMVAAEVNV